MAALRRGGGFNLSSVCENKRHLFTGGGRIASTATLLEAAGGLLLPPSYAPSM